MVEWNSNDGPDKGVSVSASESITDDPASRVEAWYKDQLPNWTITHERDGAFHMELRDGGYKRIVSIEEKHVELTSELPPSVSLRQTESAPVAS